MNNEIKKGNLNYDQSGRAYPDNPEIKENWECIWENDGKHYKLVGDNEHKEWKEIEKNKVMNKEKIYTEDEVKKLCTKAFNDAFNYGHYDEQSVFVDGVEISNNAEYWLQHNLIKTIESYDTNSQI